MEPYALPAVPENHTRLRPWAAAVTTGTSGFQRMGIHAQNEKQPSGISQNGFIALLYPGPGHLLTAIPLFFVYSWCIFCGLCLFPSRSNV